MDRDNLRKDVQGVMDVDSSTVVSGAPQNNPDLTRPRAT